MNSEMKVKTFRLKWAGSGKREARARKKARGQTPRCPVCGSTMQQCDLAVSSLDEPTVIYRMWTCVNLSSPKHLEGGYLSKG